MRPKVYYANYMEMYEDLDEAKLFTPKPEHCDLRSYVLTDAYQDLERKLSVAREALELRFKLTSTYSELTVGEFLSSIQELWKKQDEALKTINEE